MNGHGRPGRRPPNSGLPEFGLLSLQAGFADLRWLAAHAARILALAIVEQFREPRVERRRNALQRIEPHVDLASFQFADERLSDAGFVGQYVLRKFPFKPQAAQIAR